MTSPDSTTRTDRANSTDANRATDEDIPIMPSPASPSTAFALEEREAPAFFTVPSHRLARFILFVCILALDCLVRSALPHTLTYLAPLASFGIAAFAVFVGLGYGILKSDRTPLPFHLGFFLGHVIALAALCLESAAAAAGHEPAWISPSLLFALRIALSIAAVIQLALACIPLPQWIALRRATGPLWLFAIITGALTYLLRTPLQSLWTAQNFAAGRWLQSATFACVSHLLTPLVPGLEVDAPGFVFSAPNFAIYIAPECSGLEGLGLTLVFTAAWLTWFRREFRFPRALLLIPAALAAVWILNILRITALMLIGNSISPDIALTGFHSQAGWIAFTLVALAFSVASRHLPWIQKSPAQHAAVRETSGESAATPAYLVPFLAILAASFISKAASGSFEWLYPLRFLGALVALYCYRRTYRQLDLRFHWTAFVAGLFVSLLWIVPSLGQRSGPDSIAIGLAHLPPPGRFSWITCRAFAAFLTVPIAEELAFRGFLARRFISRHFDQIPYAQLTLLPTAISSIIFGLMHGSHWLAGTVAGLVFALLARRFNRLGDAIVAHATGNLFLALWVIGSSNFRLW